MLTYQQACDKLRGKQSKKLENNTYLIRVDEKTVAIRLHSTNVVTITEENHYTLNSGGWHTATTKDRLNHYGPVCIHQENFSWYVGRGKGLEFHDGMTFDHIGNLLESSKL